jgi:hypothetical protein
MPDVINLITAHDQSTKSQAKSKSLPFFGINPAELQNTGMN